MRKGFGVVAGVALSAALVTNLVGLARAQYSPTVLLAPSKKAVASVLNAKSGIVVPPTIEDVEEMCSLLIGCPHVPLASPSNDLGTCVSTLWAELSKPEAVKFSLPIRECGMGANSCTSFRKCALGGADPKVCKGRGMTKSVGFCDSSGRAVTCSKGELVRVRDCPRFGEQCSARKGEATCTLGPCPANVPADGKAVCSGNKQKVFVCDHNRLLSFDCSAFGLECLNDPKGKPVCASPKTPTCTSTKVTCSGNDAVGCVGGHQINVKCDKSKMTCKASGKGKHTIGYCENPPLTGAECAPGTRSYCVGTNVRYCVGGHVRDFFCKGLGFSRCVGIAGQAHCSN
jgi:hypothetical protein